MASPIPPPAAAWASSLLHQSAPGKYISVEDTKQILETRGLKHLRKPDLIVLWNNLKLQPFVRNDPIRVSVSSAKKEDLIYHVSRFLLMPEASQLTPIPTNTGGTPTSNTAATPTAASQNPAPAAASAAAGSYPAVASMPNNASPFDRQPAPYAFAGMPGGQGAQLPYAMHPSVAAMAMGGNPGVFWSPYASTQNGSPFATASQNANAQTPDAAAQTQNGKTPQTANSDSSRKRKAPPPPSNPNQDIVDVDALAASIAGSFAAANGVAAPAQSVEERLWSQLKAMGFEETNKDECFEAIRRAMEKSSQPSADEVMLDILQERTEAEERAQLASDMDLARLASEQDRNNEAERLREQRKQDEEDLVLRSNLDELKNPSAENKRIMFKTSWLLGHEECVPLLKDVVNNPEHRDTKKALVKFLSQEKNANRWYDSASGSKYYFTCVAGKRMLDAFSEGGSQRLKTELELLSTEVYEAMSLPSKQNDQKIPHIFVEAKKEHHVPSDEDEGEDDDDIIVLERPAQDSSQRMQPTATLIEMT